MRHRLVIAALLLSAVSVALPVSPAAAEDCEPKSSIISKVEGWRVEQPAVSAHYKRWDRVLAAFGRSDAADPMASGEADGYAARGWGRWVAVRDELRRLEGCGFDPSAVEAEAQQDSVQPAAAQQDQQVSQLRWECVGVPPDADTIGTSEAVIRHEPEFTCGSAQHTKYPTDFRPMIRFWAESGPQTFVELRITGNVLAEGVGQGKSWTELPRRPLQAPVPAYRTDTSAWVRFTYVDGPVTVELVETPQGGQELTRASWKLYDTIACEWTTSGVTEITEGASTLSGDTVTFTPSFGCGPDDTLAVARGGGNAGLIDAPLRSDRPNHTASGQETLTVIAPDDSQLWLGGYLTATATGGAVNGESAADIAVIDDDASALHVFKDGASWFAEPTRDVIPAEREGIVTLHFRVTGESWIKSSGVSLAPGEEIGASGTVQSLSRETAHLLSGLAARDANLGRFDCFGSAADARLRLTGVSYAGENLTGRTPGAGGYVSVRQPAEWLQICKPPQPAAGTVKATATLTVEKRYQCHGLNIRMGEQWLEMEMTDAAAAGLVSLGNGVEIGVSKNLGLGNGVYRSSATRINLSVGTLTAAEIRDLVNSKTTFQNDSRANPIRVTAAGPATVAAKMVDGECEYSQTFLGFDVSSPRVAFNGGR